MAFLNMHILYHQGQKPSFHPNRYKIMFYVFLCFKNVNLALKETTRKKIARKKKKTSPVDDIFIKTKALR